ncbi:hypothetical protein OZX62_00085 [Bifidobacterium sp. ESL0690]|uniref:hypothetical protein n=1 Tax=Bifidobacterium sp. ESL0690 TaxID=2983214 RepID=UPI0023F63434|nr:hypothetical protein [Bifidobacterium sp. ESL0690]WEV46750.1 hypothetical protein OZX62_00085 [Bifidobacterium sp. ESL0690]
MSTEVDDIPNTDTTITILDEAVAIPLPDNYEQRPAIQTSDKGVADYLAIYDKLKASGIPSEPDGKPDGKTIQLILDALSKITVLRCKTDTAYVIAQPSERPWQKDTDTGLAALRQTLTEKNPNAEIIQYATKHYSDFTEEGTYNSNDIGMLGYLTNPKTPDSRYNVTIILPAHGKEAMISMTSSTEHLLARAMEFNHIADSIQLLEPNEPAGPEPDPPEDATK